MLFREFVIVCLEKEVCLRMSGPHPRFTDADGMAEFVLRVQASIATSTLPRARGHEVDCFEKVFYGYLSSRVNVGIDINQDLTYQTGV